MRRKSLDQVLSLTGLVLTVALVVVGILAMWGGNFAKDSVKQQLEVQNIAFSEDAESLPAELADWAGVAVTDGDSAKAYSDLIAVHINSTTGGMSYSEVSNQWFADGKPGPAVDQKGVPPVWLTSICSVVRCWKDVCYASCLSGRVPS